MDYSTLLKLKVYGRRILQLFLFYVFIVLLFKTLGGLFREISILQALAAGIVVLVVIFFVLWIPKKPRLQYK